MSKAKFISLVTGFALSVIFGISVYRVTGSSATTTNGTGSSSVINKGDSVINTKAQMLQYIKDNGSFVPYSSEYVQSLGIKTD